MSKFAFPSSASNVTSALGSDIRCYKVVELDGEHVLAHRALGHVRDQGRWTTRDEEHRLLFVKILSVTVPIAPIVGIFR